MKALEAYKTDTGYLVKLSLVKFNTEQFATDF